MTRAELVVFLGRALNLNGAQRQTQFPDVSKTLFASGFIQTAAENGLISGFS
ncbi:S-layer homology domain-containing protein [Anaerobacillus sp. HL2]|nr:S-layer homology domain-containing protein [Anaerobacillus sp. HL2]